MSKQVLATDIKENVLANRKNVHKNILRFKLLKASKMNAILI